MAKPPQVTFELAGQTVTVSNPDKVFFAEAGITKLDLVTYYLAVADGAIRGVARRPQIMKRFVNGAAGEAFFQKRAPAKHPAWIDTATFSFPSGRSAVEVVVNNAAQLVWVVNLGCIDLNPHAIRATDMERPDELRIDLDPVPGVGWPQIREVAGVAREVLAEHGLVGWPKTSGSRGAHVWVRIEPRWKFAEVRRAAIALAQEIERRAPAIATAKWWKEERHGVFVDYNQNARDRTTASAYSVRPLPDARVSMPLAWDDFVRCDPREFTLRTVPAIYAASGDAHAAIDDHPGMLDSLLALADRLAVDGKAPKQAPKVKLPVLVIANAKAKADALAGLARWQEKYPAVAAQLAPEDILVDTNRGRSSAWYRVRVNLQHVPIEQHPAQEPPEPDYDPRVEWIASP